MIRRIKSHNILNGLLFSISEFAFTALIIAPFAAYYIAHGKFLYATIAAGILFNCLTIVAFGLLQLRNGERDIGLMQVYKKGYRERIAEENPHLFIDTMILVGTILLPFVLLAFTLAELLFIKVKHG